VIDEHWFATISCLTGAKISGDAAERLRATLGVEDEVLAYLLLRTRAFADWPDARHAFRRSVRSVIRPQPGFRQLGARTESAALRSAFAAATIARMRGDVADEPVAETMTQLRLAGSGQTDEPHIFIAPTLRDQ
jgi:hypothetical protein